jgi:tetratricopeptide (TPR) repeat protein
MWYNKAINFDPISIEAINGKGLSLFELGKHQEAIKLYDKALKIDPSLLVSIYYKTRSLEELGESQLAAEYFKNASNIYYERSVN